MPHDPDFFAAMLRYEDASHRIAQIAHDGSHHPQRTYPRAATAIDSREFWAGLEDIVSPPSPREDNPPGQQEGRQNPAVEMEDLHTRQRESRPAVQPPHAEPPPPHDPHWRCRDCCLLRQFGSVQLTRDAEAVHTRDMRSDQHRRSPAIYTTCAGAYIIFAAYDVLFSSPDMVLFLVMLRLSCVIVCSHAAAIHAIAPAWHEAHVHAVQLACLVCLWLSADASRIVVGSILTPPYAHILLVMGACGYLNVPTLQMLGCILCLDAMTCTIGVLGCLGVLPVRSPSYAHSVVMLPEYRPSAAAAASAVPHSADDAPSACTVGLLAVAVSLFSVTVVGGTALWRLRRIYRRATASAWSAFGYPPASGGGSIVSISSIEGLLPQVTAAGSIRFASYSPGDTTLAPAGSSWVQGAEEDGATVPRQANPSPTHLAPGLGGAAFVCSERGIGNTDSSDTDGNPAVHIPIPLGARRASRDTPGADDAWALALTRARRVIRGTVIPHLEDPAEEVAFRRADAEEARADMPETILLFMLGDLMGALLDWMVIPDADVRSMAILARTTLCLPLALTILLCVRVARIPATTLRSLAWLFVTVACIVHASIVVLVGDAPGTTITVYWIYVAACMRVVLYSFISFRIGARRPLLGVGLIVVGCTVGPSLHRLARTHFSDEIGEVVREIDVYQLVTTVLWVLLAALQGFVMASWQGRGTRVVYAVEHRITAPRE